VYSYEEKHYFLVVLDRLRSLKLMHNAGININGVDFTPNYPVAYELSFIFDVLEKMFPARIVYWEDLQVEEYSTYVVYQVFLSVPELRQLDPDSLDRLEQTLKILPELEETDYCYWRETPPFNDVGFVYDHRGRACGIWLEVIESDIILSPEVEILVRFYTQLKEVIENGDSHPYQGGRDNDNRGNRPGENPAQTSAA
jgi:hypothetical protein